MQRRTAYPSHLNVTRDTVKDGERLGIETADERRFTGRLVEWTDVLVRLQPMDGRGEFTVPVDRIADVISFDRAK